MLTDSAAIDFVSDAYTHLKAIEHDAHAGPLLDAAQVQIDRAVTGVGPHFLTAASGRCHEREPLVVPVL